MTSEPEKEDNVHVGQFGPELSAGKRESVADVLVRARERHGQNLRSVAQILRIRLPYLQALENGDFDKLPGTAYALGFLRTYANYLGLNADNIVDRYKEEAQATERPTELIFPEPVVEGRIPGGAIILISVVLLTVAYGSWFALTNQGRNIADLVPALPDQIQALIESDPDTPVAAPQALVATAEAPLSEPDPAPIQAEASPEPEPAPATQAPAVTENQPEAAPEPEPETESVALDGGDQPAETTQTQTTTRIQAAALPEEDSVSDTAPLDYIPTNDPAPAPELEAPSQAAAPAPEPRTSLEAREESQETGVQHEPETEVVQTIVIPAPPSSPQDFASLGERTPRVYGQGNDGARIVLRALQDSWVQVRDNQDALLLTRVLRSGDIYKVPDQAGLTLLTGNAGGIQLEVDGVAIAPLGPVGSVRRQIALDPSVLLTGSTQ